VLRQDLLQPIAVTKTLVVGMQSSGASFVTYCFSSRNCRLAPGGHKSEEAAERTHCGTVLAVRRRMGRERHLRPAPDAESAADGVEAALSRRRAFAPLRPGGDVRQRGLPARPRRAWLFDYIEVFYNQRRRHSALGQISPAEFERRAARHLFLPAKRTGRTAINLGHTCTEADQGQGLSVLGMKVPADVYTRSTRVYRGVEDLTYPFHDRTIMVTTCGRLCFDSRKINFSQVFTGQRSV
jgi:integrase-like protein